MDCPKCHAVMEAVSVQEALIDRCTLCGGMWFDAREAVSVHGVGPAATLDQGDASIGAQWDRQRDIECPACGAAMLRKHTLTAPPIRYEWCPTCKGHFLDAGEFRALQQSRSVG